MRPSPQAIAASPPDRARSRAIVRGWRVRRAAVLLPVAQGRDGQVERLGKFRLRHSEPLPQHPHARYRLIFASCSGVSGCASGSDSAAVMTSSSVLALSRSQLVSPRGRGHQVSRLPA